MLRNLLENNTMKGHENTNLYALLLSWQNIWHVHVRSGLYFLYCLMFLIIIASRLAFHCFPVNREGMEWHCWSRSCAFVSSPRRPDTRDRTCFVLSSIYSCFNALFPSHLPALSRSISWYPEAGSILLSLLHLKWVLICFCHVTFWVFASFMGKIISTS